MCLWGVFLIVLIEVEGPSLNVSHGWAGAGGGEGTRLHPGTHCSLLWLDVLWLAVSSPCTRLLHSDGLWPATGTLSPWTCFHHRVLSQQQEMKLKQCFPFSWFFREMLSRIPGASEHSPLTLKINYHICQLQNVVKGENSNEFLCCFYSLVAIICHCLTNLPTPSMHMYTSKASALT